MKAEDLRRPLSDLTDNELSALMLKIRKKRRESKKPKAKAKAKTKTKVKKKVDVGGMSPDMAKALLEALQAQENTDGTS
jgi:hypothetical protein